MQIHFAFVLASNPKEAIRATNQKAIPIMITVIALRKWTMD
jgi:hypothetical protein